MQQKLDDLVGARDRALKEKEEVLDQLDEARDRIEADERFLEQFERRRRLSTRK